MGIYDRDYYRDDRPGLHLQAPRTAVGYLILINVIVYLIDALFVQPDVFGGDRLADLFGVHVSTLTHPAMWWQFLTYGFVHARDPLHVIGNMLVLFFLGREVEQRYGTKEFTWIYLVTIVAGGVFWAAANKLRGMPDDSIPVVGASGGITGIVLLYAMNFPRRTLLLFFVLPVPAWVLGVLVVASDALGAAGHSGDVAYSVHLAGAALAAMYFWFGWNFSRYVDNRFWRQWLAPRPGLKVHYPKDDEADTAVPGADLAEQVDHILEKIHREGESSLTRRERRVLESASREYQRRRRSP